MIAVSGATRSDPLTQGLVVDEFIGKPFDIEHVVSSVRKFAYDLLALAVALGGESISPERVNWVLDRSHLAPQR